MKKIMILALSAVMVMSVSAQEQKREEFKGKKHECTEKKLSKEERIELDIKRLSNELMLSDAQAEKFAVTFREYANKKAELFTQNAPKDKEPRKELSDAELDQLAKKRFEAKKKAAELDEIYYDKFRKDLSARQVAKVLRLDKPCGGKHEGCPGHGDFEQKPCCKKGEGGPGHEGCPKHEKKHKHGPAPETPKE